MVKEQSPWLPDPFVFIFALKTALRESCYSFIQVQCKLFIASFRVLHSGVPLSKKTSEKNRAGDQKKDQSQQQNDHENIINKMPLKLKKLKIRGLKNLTCGTVNLVFIIFNCTIYHNAPTSSPILCFPQMTAQYRTVHPRFGEKGEHKFLKTIYPTRARARAHTHTHCFDKISLFKLLISVVRIRQKRVYSLDRN